MIMTVVDAILKLDVRDISVSPAFDYTTIHMEIMWLVF